MKHVMNSVWYGPFDSCQKALPEKFEVRASNLTMILGEKPPPQKKKLKKNKFVLKWFLVNFRCFKHMFFFQKKKKK